MSCRMPWDSLILYTASIAIQCSPDLDGEVRLVNGTTLQEGRLEICINSNWSTVCDDMWGNADARVVCRQLGYNENGKSALNSSETSLAIYYSPVLFTFPDSFCSWSCYIWSIFWTRSWVHSIGRCQLYWKGISAA